MGVCVAQLLHDNTLNPKARDDLCVTETQRRRQFTTTLNTLYNNIVMYNNDIVHVCGHRRNSLVKVHIYFSFEVFFF